jgi:tetratricopeptide (TPR) repeat protein
MEFPESASTNFSQLPNPYDFANPVGDREVFAGRSEEMQEIKYYLDHASKADRAINLAIIGNRASGKTSLLNMIALEARDRGFCIVRVDLDEGDVETQLGFFHKLFDSILFAACSLGAYGGLTAKTYDVYTDMAYGYEIPLDKTFCPFTFPIQYAKAMSKSNLSVPLSDIGFKKDIASIQMELKSPIVIIFDECDVLSKSRVHLEKLRNIFMNTAGYMLVFTGTPALFPVIDDVFSPIIRQFKKINVGPFEQEEETESCIRKPLKKIGIIEPSDIFDFETYRDVSQIHDLSGGRPYEIQLICHFLFRRIQDGRAKHMELSIDVLDDVLGELQTTQDVSTRPIITAVRGSDHEQLSALSLLCSCNSRATFEQLWFSTHIFQKDEHFTRESLLSHLDRFQKMNILSANKEGFVSFTGDDFDRIYCKYFARKHGVRLAINDLPFELLLAFDLDSHIARKLPGVQPAFVFSATLGQEPSDLSEQVNALAKEFISDTSVVNPFDINPSIAALIYQLSAANQEDNTFQLVTVTINTPWLSVRRYYKSEYDERTLPIVMSNLKELSERIEVAGGELIIDINQVPIVPLEKLKRDAMLSDNSRVREELASFHSFEVTRAYFGTQNNSKALIHAELAYLYRSNFDRMNNLGYLYMVQDDDHRAKELFKEAIEKSTEDQGNAALPTYNLATAEAKSGNLEYAKELLLVAIDRAASLDAEDRRCSCLMIPKRSDNGVLTFSEVRGPNVLETAREALSILCSIDEE